MAKDQLVPCGYGSYTHCHLAVRIVSIIGCCHVCLLTVQAQAPTAFEKAELVTVIHTRYAALNEADKDQSADRTASNTNDPRDKILRIDPLLTGPATKGMSYQIGFDASHFASGLFPFGVESTAIIQKGRYCCEDEVFSDVLA